MAPAPSSPQSRIFPSRGACSGTNAHHCFTSLEPILSRAARQGRPGQAHAMAKRIFTRTYLTLPNKAFRVLETGCQARQVRNFCMPNHQISSAAVVDTAVLATIPLDRPSGFRGLQGAFLVASRSTGSLLLHAQILPVSPLRRSQIRASGPCCVGREPVTPS